MRWDIFEEYEEQFRKPPREHWSWFLSREEQAKKYARGLRLKQTALEKIKEEAELMKKQLSEAHDYQIDVED